MYIYIYIYTGCPRRNVPDFGRVFLRSNYTDITQNTYNQSSMVTEILAREKCGLLWCLRSILCRDVIRLNFTATILQQPAAHSDGRPSLRNICSECIVVGSQWTTMRCVRVFLQFNLMAVCHSQVTLMLRTAINITETTYSCQFQYVFGNQ